MFPNGTITALANLSKQYAYAIVDVRVAYSENLDRVIGTHSRSRRLDGAAIRRGGRWFAPLEIAGIESIDDGAATIRVKFKTYPLNQGKVANELRRRLLSMLVGRRIRPFV